ncbi:MAG: rod shape-determining protein MreD [Nitrospirota bacterium]|jgi:rod shape-determining protein MreD
MRKTTLALTLVVALILESRVRVSGIGPNLTVLFVIYAGLRGGPLRGLTAGAGLGFLTDVLSAGMLGPDILAKGTVGYLSAFLGRGVFTWTPLLGLVGFFVLTFLDGTLSYGLTAAFERAALGATHAAVISFWQALLVAPAGLFMRPRDEN